MALTLTPVEHLFVPFVVVLACAYASGAHRDGREAYAGLALVVAALPVIIATMDDRGRRRLHLPAADRHRRVARRAARSARARG